MDTTAQLLTDSFGSNRTSPLTKRPQPNDSAGKPIIICSSSSSSSSSSSPVRTSGSRFFEGQGEEVIGVKRRVGEMDPWMLDDSQNPALDCALESSLRMANDVAFGFSLLFLVLAPRFIHYALAPLRQPRLLSEIIFGLIFGNTDLFKAFMDSRVSTVLESLSEFTMAAYMFVTGLEMDARSIFHRPGREAAISYAGIATTVALFLTLYPVIDRGLLSVAEMHSWEVALVLGVILAGISSPVLTRLTTELKIGKSDIGRLAVNAGLQGDMVTTLFLCFFSTLMRNKWMAMKGNHGESEHQVDRGVIELLFATAGFGMEAAVIFKVMPRYMDWINRRNPVGKKMRVFDLALSLLLIYAMCFLGAALLFSFRINALLVGLFLPREGRVATQLVSKINFYLATVGIPLFLCQIGMSIHVGAWTGLTMNMVGQPIQWSWGASIHKLAVLFFISTIGKIIGTFFAASHHGLRPPEAIALGLLLNVKGIFHIFLIAEAKQVGLVNDNTATAMLLVVMGSIVFIPLVVAAIVWRQRKRVHRRLMGLQWHNPATELRMVVGIHGPQNVPAFINIIEATRGGARAPLHVYAMDLIELNDRAAATLARGQGGLDAVTVMDEGIMETRNAITHALDSYVQGSGAEGLTIRRLFAVSSYTDMYLDICNGAEDTMAALVILPFHHTQLVDGGMDSGRPEHRLVNEKVLQHAPCTVGVLVDRGLGGLKPSSMSHGSVQVAAIFIGGSDDREALTYAGQMAQHPGVHLTAIRFLHASRAGDAARPATTLGHMLGGQESEMQQDEACFAEFYERHIADGRVEYVERYVENGSETVATLRALEGLYSLFLVGARGERDPDLTAGIGDWAENPMLGPIGDVLASSDFSVTASVLVIQQHSQRRNLDGAIDAEFAVP